MFNFFYAPSYLLQIEIHLFQTTLELLFVKLKNTIKSFNSCTEIKEKSSISESTSEVGSYLIRFMILQEV